MKHFINDRATIVTEALDSMVRMGEGKLARLDGYPAIKVLLRADADRSKVSVISGGGSGHEPAHAGFVGRGLLTAAVLGEIFASPSVDAVLAAILAVTGDAGCLLIVKSYTGDRLNFGLAAEKARALGIAVETVIVADDIALPDVPHPRGVAGTLFVHKVAGHLAERGASLAEIKTAAERVASSVRSLGVALTSCTIPGQPVEARVGPEEIELGLGIHGEPGAQKIAHQPIRDLAVLLARRLDDALPSKGPIALLINDLGSVPPIEMAVATNAILSATSRDVRLVFGPGRLMTSLDMKGLSVSALALDDALEEALLSEVGPSAWQRGRRVGVAPAVPVHSAVAGTPPAASEEPRARATLGRVCEALIAAEAELNGLDAKIGDGDTGSTFGAAARAVLSQMNALPLADPPALCAALGDLLAKVMGGSSGILLSIGLRAMEASLRAKRSERRWAAALKEAIERIQIYGGAREGDRTMLDALIPAVVVLDRGGAAGEVARAAEAGAAHTATLSRARAGRASYVPGAALHGVPDPGALAIAKIFVAIARV